MHYICFFSYTDGKHELLGYFNVPRFDCPELIMPAEDEKLFEETWYSVSEMYFMFLNIFVWKNKVHFKKTCFV